MPLWSALGHADGCEPGHHARRARVTAGRAADTCGHAVEHHRPQQPALGSKGGAAQAVRAAAELSLQPDAEPVSAWEEIFDEVRRSVFGAELKAV